eukprot:CAMPEP_0113879710 /NCGR_PEP_ID=MMETSP0780_2-20120614/7385_1 /TAXON_ID=652834 /ORGANISM="Palpitomonas bilix" /LENGTH=486 /DNA_ID=CAMNT_0000866313 /DNA_START=177 /DNA_END=1640 /DNA_ORIENTATION=+ /assembly_acc=CAM_ASM_000599
MELPSLDELEAEISAALAFDGKSRSARSLGRIGEEDARSSQRRSEPDDVFDSHASSGGRGETNCEAYHVPSPPERFISHGYVMRKKGKGGSWKYEYFLKGQDKSCLTSWRKKRYLPYPMFAIAVGPAFVSHRSVTNISSPPSPSSVGPASFSSSPAFSPPLHTSSSLPGVTMSSAVDSASLPPRPHRPHSSGPAVSSESGGEASGDELQHGGSRRSRMGDAASDVADDGGEDEEEGKEIAVVVGDSFRCDFDVYCNSGDGVHLGGDASDSGTRTPTPERRQSGEGRKQRRRKVKEDKKELLCLRFAGSSRASTFAHLALPATSHFDHSRPYVRQGSGKRLSRSSSPTPASMSPPHDDASGSGGVGGEGDAGLELCLPLCIKEGEKGLKERIRKKQLTGLNTFVSSNKVGADDPSLDHMELRLHERSIVKSTKNMQFVQSDEDFNAVGKKVVFSMGKMSKEKFSVDFGYPLSPLQAFGMAIAIFEHS